MQSDHFELMSFVLEESQHLPVVRRIKVLRGLAAVCGDPDEQSNLNSVASQLTEADALCREFNFSFVQKYKANGNSR